jgi:nephrocystin-3
MSDAPLRSRQIRVFISSTFRDMQADRDELVKKVFPRLRKLCESRAVTWTEVDLRWGITSEQQAEGKVLPYCLAEIERSRPFFIGLLGERYGWVPQSMPAELVEQQPWLREHLEHSVTEIEILHGVLNNPAMAGRALFYFRDPAYVAVAPAGKKDDFVETGPRAKRMQRKLTALKERIRTAAAQKKLKYPPRENYADPKALGDLIRADFTRIIEELYPPAEVPDPLDQEANRHEEYARSRRDLYIPRPRYFELLDQHVESANPPLVLTGESGCGKTALLANWVERYRESHPQDLIIQHYIGSTPDSADWIRVVSRILGELKRGFNLGDELPSTPEKLRSALDEWLVKTAAGRRIVLVLDGLNQLEDRDNAPDLAWLPRVFPTNVRVLASSLPGRALDATQQRQWRTMTVELLNADERRQIVTGYLALGGRTASKELLSAIEAHPQTLNPLYLRTFLDEIRVFGRYEELYETMENYLRAATPSDLYRLIIQRWVRDYPEARVANALRLIWAARRGLSEPELMDLLGHDGEPLPRGRWTPFYLVAERSLSVRAGLVNFGHDYLREAVQRELFADSSDAQRAEHRRLATYFDVKADPTQRTIDELLWQLREAKEWKWLVERMGNVPLVSAIWSVDRYQLSSTWTDVEATLPGSLPEAYTLVLRDPGSYIWLAGQRPEVADFLLFLAEIMRYCGYPDQAFRLCDGVAKAFDHIYLEGALRALVFQGILLLERDHTDDLETAWSIFAGVRRVSHAGGHLRMESTAMAAQESILLECGNNEQALQIIGEHRLILEELADWQQLAGCLGHEAVAYMQLGNLQKALEIYAHEESLCRLVGDLDSLQVCLGNQATLKMKLNHWSEALELLTEQEGICHQIGKMPSLANCYSNQAFIHAQRGELVRAAELLKHQEMLARKMGSEKQLRIALSAQKALGLD